MPGSLASRMSGQGQGEGPSGPYGPQNPAPPPPGPPPTGPKHKNANKQSRYWQQNKQNGNVNHNKQNPNNARQARVKKERDGRGGSRCSKSVKLKRQLKAKKFYDEMSEEAMRDKYVDEADRVPSARREGVFQEVDWDDGDRGDQVPMSTGYQQEDSSQHQDDRSIHQSTETGGIDSHRSAYVYENHAQEVEDEVDWGDDDEDDAGIHAPPPPAQIEYLQAAQPGHVQASQSDYAQNPAWDYRTAQAPQSDYSQTPQTGFDRGTSQNSIKHKDNLPSPAHDNIPSSHTSGHYDHYQMQGLTLRFANHHVNQSAGHSRRRPGAGSHARGSQYEGTRRQQNAFCHHNTGYRDAQAQPRGVAHHDNQTGHHEHDRGREQSRQGSVRGVESQHSEVHKLPDFGSSYRNQTGPGKNRIRARTRTSPEKVNCPSTVYDLRDYDKQVTALHRGLPANERFKNGNGKVAPYVYGSVQGYDLGLCFSTFCTAYMCEMGTKCAWRHHPLSKVEREWINAARSANGAEFLKGEYWFMPDEPVPGANMHEKQNGRLQGA